MMFSSHHPVLDVLRSNTDCTVLQISPGELGNRERSPGNILEAKSASSSLPGS